MATINVIRKGPKYRTAKDLVLDGTFPVSEATLLQLARKHEIGRMMGRLRIFSDDDVVKLYEALPCHSSSSVDQIRPTGSCAAPSAEFALRKARALLTGGSRRKSG